MSRMPPAVEARILAAVETAVDGVDGGLSPTAAVIKAAAAHALAAPQVRLLAQAYNTGVTSSIRKTADDVRGRAAAVPLADAGAAIEALFPKSPATPSAVKAAAVSVAYSRPLPAAVRGRRPPPLEKAAAAGGPAPRVPAAGEVLDACREAARHLDRLWQPAAAAGQKMAAALAGLEDHFRLAACRSPHTLRVAAVQRFGDDADVVMDVLRLSKRAAMVKAGGAVDWDRSPFKEMAAVVAAGRELAAARYAALQFDADAGAKLARLVDAVRPPAGGTLLAGLPAPTEVSVAAAARRLTGLADKRASAAGDVAKGVAMGSILDKLHAGMPAEDSPEAAKAKAFAKLTDPVHEARLDTLRRRFMLTNLMANDPVIKGYKPQEVLHVYNQISQMAPRAASQEMLVQALLRRHLAQGQVDPHEVDQLAGIEGKLKSNDEPTDYRKLPDRLPYVVNRPSPKPPEAK